MNDLPFASEQLSRAAEHYLADRYPFRTLVELTSARQMQQHDNYLASTLLTWRKDAQWPEPEVIGELRCASCHVVMHEELSVCEDETICAKCAPDEDVSTPSARDAT